MSEALGRGVLPFLTGLVLALAYIPNVPAAAISARWWTLAIAAAVMLFSAKPGWPAVIFLGFVGYVGASLAWTPNPAEGLGYVAQWAILWMCFASAPDPRALLRGAALGLVASAIVAAGQAFDLINIGGFGNSGLFVNHNTLSEAAVVVLVGTFVYGDWLFAIPPAVALGFSFSRGSLVALGICLSFQLDRKVGFALIAAIAIGLGIFFFHPIPSVAERFTFWNDAWTGLSWLGQGVGSFSFNFPYARQVHNDYLQMAYEFGVGGAGLAAALALALSRYRHDPGAASALLAVCVLAMFAFPFQMSFTGGLAAFMAGRLCSLRQPVHLDWRKWRGLVPGLGARSNRSKYASVSVRSDSQNHPVRSRDAAVAAAGEG